MANPTCTRDTLKSGASCINGRVRDKHKQKVLMVWFMAKQLGAIGGGNYLTNAASISIMKDDAKALTCGLDRDARETAKLLLEYNNAVAAGATVSTDPSKLASDVACLDNYSDDMLERMQILLRCKLGRGKAYPQ